MLLLRFFLTAIDYFHGFPPVKRTVTIPSPFNCVPPKRLLPLWVLIVNICGAIEIITGSFHLKSCFHFSKNLQFAVCTSQDYSCCHSVHRVATPQGAADPQDAFQFLAVLTSILVLLLKHLLLLASRTEFSLASLPPPRSPCKHYL